MPLRAAHLEDMRLRGLVPETTIYARRLTLARLEAWLAGYHEEHPRPGRVPSVEAGPGLLEDATAADLLAWRASLTLTPRSVATNCVHVREFYRWLQAAGYRADNPAAGIPVPRTGRSLPRPISEEDLSRAFESAPRRIRPWLVLAGWAGLRAKEIALLRRENVIDTAARPYLLIAEDATKGRSEHIVWLSDFVLEELRAYGMPSQGYVFRRFDGGAGPNKPWLISRLANQHLHRSGTDATLHQLRHRCATQVHDVTGDIRLVQEMLGHRSLETTQVYTKVSNARAASAMNAIPAPRRLHVVGE